MRKYIFLLCALLITLLLLLGCGIKTNEEEKEKINKTDEVVKLLEDFNGFNAKVKVTYFLGEEEVIFEMLQDGTIDGKYKIEITSPEALLGNTTYCDGESIYNVNLNKSSQIYSSMNDYPQRIQILLSAFVDNYKNKTKEFSKIYEESASDVILLEGVIDGGNTYFATERLTINATTYKPIKLDIYTNEGEKIVEIEYLEFVYNPNFEENYFTPMQK